MNYAVNENLSYNNRHYAPGAVVEMDEAQAAPLVLLGVLAEAAAPPAAPSDPSARESAIVSAIGQLDPAIAANWTAGGSPATAALAGVLGWAVTAAERDAAWAAFGANS